MSAIDFAVFSHADTEIDHDLRRQSVSATDVAKICGKSNYGTAWDVYAIKTGLVEPQFQTSEALEIGTYMQYGVCALYQKRSGNVVEWFDKTVTHPTQPWMSATPDGLINQAPVFETPSPFDPNGLYGVDSWSDVGVYEGKTAGSAMLQKWGEEWTDEIPDEYLLQTIWQAIVTGRRFVDVAVLLGGQPLSVKCYRVEPDARTRRAVYDRVRSFWFDNVVARKPPEILASSIANLYLSTIANAADFREATEQEMGWLDELRTWEGRPAKDEKAIEDLRTKLKQSIGESAGLIGPWGKASYKKNKDTVSVDWEGYANALEEACTDLLFGGDADRTKQGFTKTRSGNRPLTIKFKT